MTFNAGGVGAGGGVYPPFPGVEHHVGIAPPRPSPSPVSQQQQQQQQQAASPAQAAAGQGDLHKELLSERQLSDSRLADIRSLQAQLNELRLRQASAPPPTQSEDALRRAVHDERRRADNERAVAEERLADIRRLQQQLHDARESRPAAEELMQQLGQVDAKSQALVQREAALAAELRKEQRRTEQRDEALREREGAAAHMQAELAQVKAQYVDELSRHQHELEAWKQEREGYRQNEEHLAAQLRAKQEQGRQEMLGHVTQGKEREERLRVQADKEWNVAEERLGEIRSLQKQVTSLHSNLTQAHNQIAAEKAAMQAERSQEVKQVRAEGQAQMRLLEAKLEEEREESRQRLLQSQAFERHIAELGERLAQQPEGEDQRQREAQKQLEATLAAHRSDMAEQQRRHKAELREAERRLQAERANTEDRAEDVKAAQHAAAEERAGHKKATEELQRLLEESNEKNRLLMDKQKDTQSQREELLRTQIDVEKQTANDRLREVRQLQKQLQDVHNEHLKELAEQHKARERMAHETRQREEETRRKADELIEQKERSLAERERQLLTMKEEAVNAALRQASEQEGDVRREVEQRFKAQLQRTKDELAYREQEEQRRVQELTRLHGSQMEMAKGRERKAQEECEAALEASLRAQRDAEALRYEMQQQRADLTREFDEEARKLRTTIREVQEQGEGRRKEVVRQGRELDSLKAQLAAADAGREESTAQLTALEAELGRHVEIITVQKEELASTRSEIDVRVEQCKELQAHVEVVRHDSQRYQDMLADAKPELAKLAADNCKLQAENATLADREKRLRSWAQQVAPRTMG